MNAKRHRTGGFTLLELLAGMAIFVLIAGTAYTALRSAGRIWEAVDARSEADGGVRLAMDYLRRQLSKAFPLAVRSEDRWQAWFEGDRRRITFLVEGSRRVGLSGLYQFIVLHNRESRPPSVDLVLQPVEERLRIGEVRHRALRRTLIENVADATFTFFGRREPDGDAVWHTRWHNRERLPELVRLRLRGAAFGDWPALTVRLPVDGLRFHRSGAWEDGLVRPQDRPDGETAR